MTGWRGVALAAALIAGVALAVYGGARYRAAVLRSDADGPSTAVEGGGTSPSDGAAAGAAGPSEADVERVIAQLRSDPPARDQAVIARRMGRIPADGPLPRQLAAGTPRVYAEGDVEPFWVHDIPNNRHLRVQARLEVIGAHAYLWVQEGQPFDRPGLESGSRAFDTEIYPRVRAVFGSEWSPGVDNDPRVHILHTEPIAGIAGFYSSADEATRAVDEKSNAREIFYVNLQTYAPGTPDYLQLLAHEFQHMIHWHQDLGEPVWVNEGLSEVAPYVAGYGRQNGAAYLSDTDVSLPNWEATGGNNGPHYAAGFLFFEWLRGLYGDAFLTELVKAQGNGMNGVDEALALANANVEATPMADFNMTRGHGCQPKSFDAAFACWAVANSGLPVGLAVTDAAYANPGIGTARIEGLPPGGISSTVQPYGVDYWDVTSLVGADGRIALQFEGDPTVPLLPDAPPGHIWWSNSADSADSRLMRTFDLTDVAADAAPVLTWRSWYALEDSWDYAYLMASTDGGSTWRTVPTLNTRTDNPNGNSLGDGLTGEAYGWIDDSADLTPFAGQRVDIAFEVITDDAVSLEGWAIDDIALEALGFHDDAEADGDWMAEGWLRVDPTLPQRWSVQYVQRGATTNGMQLDTGTGPWPASQTIEVDDVDPDGQVIVIVSAMTPGTRHPGRYRLWPQGGATPVEGAYPGPGGTVRDGGGTGYP